MGRRHDLVWVAFILILLFLTGNGETEKVKVALVTFMERLNPQTKTPDWGWNATSDPCHDQWIGVSCDSNQESVKKIVLDRLSLAGLIDGFSLCKATSLRILSLSNNNLTGTLPEIIVECQQLTHLYVNDNNLSGPLPLSLVYMSNLKRLDISNNHLSDNLPQMSKVSGLLGFLAQNNQLSGTLVMFNFSNLQEFNVSNNNFTGPIPDGGGRFPASSFSGNLGLCGKPLPNACPPNSTQYSDGRPPA